MGKSKKKKRSQQGTGSTGGGVTSGSISDLCSVSGLAPVDETAADNIFGCLAELDAGIAGADDADDDVKPGSGATGRNHSSIATAAASDRSFQTFATQEVSLPPIRVELLRHKLMGQLSSYLLKECSDVNLRMPTFERWLVDNKMEERDKRRVKLSVAAAAGGEGGKKRKRARDSAHDAYGSSHTRSLLSFADPVIPCAPDVEDASSSRLVMEICESSAANEDDDDNASEKQIEMERATQICRELCLRSADAAMQVYRLDQRLGSASSSSVGTDGGRGSSKKKNKSSRERIRLEKGDRDGDIDARGATSTTYALVYERKAAKKRKTHRRGDGGGDDDAEEDGDKSSKSFVVKINSTHYNKLRTMFDVVHPSQDAHTIHTFHHLLFVLLLRYSSLAGGHLLNDLRGGGMQGSVNEAVFAFLDKFSSKVGHDLVGECFASPLNANLGVGQYRSGFYGDIDKHFGSIGDFFKWEGIGNAHRGQWYECNPPFSPGLMLEMANHLLQYLAEADEEDSAISFVVIVPSCEQASRMDDAPAARRFASPGYNAMVKSPYQTHHILLGSGEHGYIEGAQHLRPTRFKTSRYDTSVILLQSKSARHDMGRIGGSKWKDMFEMGIRAAFGSGHEDETKERKRKADGVTDRGEGKKKASFAGAIGKNGRKKKKKHRCKK